MVDNIGTFRGAPLLRTLLPFMLGIWIATYMDMPTTYPLALGAGCVLVYVALELFVRKGIQPLWKKRASHLVLFLGICSIGTLRLDDAKRSQTSAPFAATYTSGMYWKATILKTDLKPTYKRYTAHIEQLIAGDTIHPVSMDILLYDYEKRVLENESEIISNAPLVPLQNKGNPGEFDLKNFYRRKGIFYSAFLNASSPILLLPADSTSLPHWKHHIKQSITSILEKALGKDELSLSLSLALLLGKEVNHPIDEVVLSDFITTGIIHIIVISGFQVGILASALGGLFGIFFRGRRLWIVVLQGLLTLGGVWMFIYVVGMDVSVFRAGIMFSVMYANRSLGNRKKNPFQLLALSAFIILLLSPYDLWNLGFMYSFLALFGIFLCDYPIKKQVQQLKAPRWLKFLVEESLVTLGASLFTIPITAAYFGKFYTYFLFAGLGAVHLSIVLLFLICGLLLVCWCAPLVSLLAYAIHWVAYGLYQYVHFWAGCPLASIPFFVSPPQCILLILGGFMIVYFIKYPSYKHSFFLGLLCVWGFFGLALLERISVQKRHELYALRWNASYSPLLLVNQDKATLIVDTAWVSSSKKRDYLIHGLIYGLHLRQLNVQHISSERHLVLSDEKHRVLCLAKPTDSTSLPHDSLIRSSSYIVLHQPTPSLLSFLQRQWKDKYIIYSNASATPKDKRASYCTENGAYLLFP